jgi:hypothetical protein
MKNKTADVLRAGKKKVNKKGHKGPLGTRSATNALRVIGKNSSGAPAIKYNSSVRAKESLDYRINVAKAENIDIGVLPGNGDEARFTDHSAIWTKSLLHDDLQIVNGASYKSFIKGLTSGKFADFEKIIMGNPGGKNFTGTLNGPQAALAFDLEGLDSHAIKIPPAPSVASAQTAAEAVEHYWAALLRDVSFVDYPSNPIAAQAVKDMNSLSFLGSAQNREFPYPVTAKNLFRGQIAPGDGCVQGPYLSQFLVQPSMLGAQPLSQKLQCFLPKQDFMTDVDEFKRIQNGQVPKDSLAFDNEYRFLHCGRSLAAYTHVDALHQAYFVAALILLEINAPLNPGNPYAHSNSEHGFGTLGGPDILGTIPELATRALKAAWFHKWIINLRQRPEEYGALVHSRLTNRNPLPQAAGALHSDVLNSKALTIIKERFDSYLLPQAFPEGAPSHPCYPTGHGTVGGACITALKFFFDGSQPIRKLLLVAGCDVKQVSSDGVSLESYTGSDRDKLTVNGELAKLAWNITQGHGIHAGIHFRSSSFYSILLGEQVGISALEARARSYNEPFRVKITKLNGKKITISNP